MDTGKLRCISFRDEILSWLDECQIHTDTGGYKYSYIKQYIGDYLSKQVIKKVTKNAKAADFIVL